MSRSKRLCGSLTRPDGLGPPVGGPSTPQVDLIQPLVLLLLLPNVVADHGLVSAHGRHPVAACPEVLADKIPAPDESHSSL